MDTTTLFDGKAKHYTAGRPGYPPQLIDRLYSHYHLPASAVIADIGSGTGKFTRLLLDRQSEVYGVEPNHHMRSVAENELRGYKNFHSVAGSAENTTLPHSFADCVTVAQAFHWFDVPKFRQECLRILKAHGTVFLVWNFRVPTAPITLDLHRLFSRYCPDFNGFSNGLRQNDDSLKLFFRHEYDTFSCDHPLTYHRENFILRCLSSSYSLQATDADYPRYIAALNELFTHYAQDDTITLPNRAVAYSGTLT